MIHGYYYRQSKRKRYGATKPRQAPATKDTPNDFDVYGKELGPEARVWKAYMKEADKFDAEELATWNQSLDVMIVFAALFSAISTSFVIAGIGDLREDPLQTSAQTLLLASQALLRLANNSQPLEISQSTIPDPTEFTRSRSAIVVNVTWILSLTLSITVAFISLIAREWLRVYKVDRGGHVYWRARERQKRIEAIIVWRLREILLVLPGLLYLAVFYFCIGLSVYLWDIYYAMALPVIVPTSLLAVFYTTTTVIPYFSRDAPFKSAVGQNVALFNEIRSLLRSLLHSLAPSLAPPLPPSTEPVAHGSQSVVHEDSQDWITGRQLAWLISNYEDPATLEIVLQAVAGVDQKWSFGPLSKYDIPTMVVQRIMSRRADHKYPKIELELYSRALKRFCQFGNIRPQDADASQARAHGDMGETNKNMLQHLQPMIEKGYAKWLLSGEFIPNDDNVELLETGITAVPTFLRASRQQEQPPKHDLELLNRAIDFLKVSNGTINSKQHEGLRPSVIASAGVLLACLPFITNPSVLISCTTRLLHTSMDEITQDILLAVFAVTQAKSHDEATGSLLTAKMREQQATRILAHSLLIPSNDPLPLGAIKNLGLLEMLLGFQSYKPDNEAAKQISQRFANMFMHPAPNIPGFPEDFNVCQHVMNKITVQVSRLPNIDAIVESEALSEAYIWALYSTYDSTSNVASAQVYMLVTEIILQTSSLTAKLKAYDLMAHFPLPTPSPTLVQLVDDRAIIPILARSRDSDDQSLKLYAVAQLCWLTGIAFLLAEEYGDKLKLLLERTLCQPGVTLESVKETLLAELHNIQNEPQALGSLPPTLESYPHRVLEFLQGSPV